MLALPGSGLEAAAEIEQIAAQVRSMWGVPSGTALNVVDLLEAH
ncbi:hypothetical protein [Streptomyces sp. NPDC004629]